MLRVLSTNKEKQEILKERGIDYLLECPFTKEVMCMEPEAFVAWIVKSLHVKSMVVGSDFLLFFIGRKDTVIIILRKFFRWNIKRKNNGL